MTKVNRFRLDKKKKKERSKSSALWSNKFFFGGELKNLGGGNGETWLKETSEA